MTLNSFKKNSNDFSRTPQLPVLFVGHGNPMNAIEKNVYSMGWQKLGKTLPTPKAVLCISAHWLSEGTFVHITEKPKTIHDFWGFPKELYEIRYPCPGSPEYANKTSSLVKKTKVSQDSNWGLDHGTWVVMRHMFPNADIPVYQMSIDVSKSHLAHYEIGKELAGLREKGVLIIGSGNIVHNLGRMNYDAESKPFSWAEEFDEITKRLILKGDHTSLIAYEKLGAAALLSVPTPDHYWPLLYILGLQGKKEQASFPINGITNGSVSMRTVLFG